MSFIRQMFGADKQARGRAGEDAALAFLRAKGLIEVERNFRCKGGEIDLILREGEVLVFVEVRLRRDDRHGGAAASVTPAKQRRLLIASQLYLQRFRQPPPCRIDVVALDGQKCNWIRNAIEN